MVYGRGWIFQQLEGPSAGVARIWALIRKDRRQTAIEVLGNGPVAALAGVVLAAGVRQWRVAGEPGKSFARVTIGLVETNLGCDCPAPLRRTACARRRGGVPGCHAGFAAAGSRCRLGVRVRQDKACRTGFSREHGARAARAHRLKARRPLTSGRLQRGRSDARSHPLAGHRP